MKTQSGYFECLAALFVFDKSHARRVMQNRIAVVADPGSAGFIQSQFRPAKLTTKNDGSRQTVTDQILPAAHHIVDPLASGLQACGAHHHGDTRVVVHELLEQVPTDQTGDTGQKTVSHG